MAKEIFPLVPASPGAYYMLVPTFLVVLGVAALLAYCFYSTRHTRCEITNEGLRIAGNVYGRLIPRAQLRVGEARSLDLKSEPDYAPRWRTNGIGLPGYRSGWFKLRNGEKALAFLTDYHSVAAVPTTAGYILLVSVAEPQRFLQALRAAPHVGY
jgi:hypothetical protein